jgi:hypothetical protein
MKKFGKAVARVLLYVIWIVGLIISMYGWMYLDEAVDDAIEDE